MSTLRSGPNDKLRSIVIPIAIQLSNNAIIILNFNTTRIDRLAKFRKTKFMFCDEFYKFPRIRQLMVLEKHYKKRHN